VVAQSTAGPYRVQDLLDAWRRTNPVHRPRIDSPEQIHDLARNGLFERMLRRTAEERRLDRRPEIALQLAEWREVIAVTHLIEREVFARAAPDSQALQDYYRRHVDEFEAPARAVVIRLLLPDRAAAGRMAARLRDHAEAESLAARGARAGVDYRGEITHEREPDLFGAAIRAGVGAVVGPDSSAGGWQVARVLENRLPRRQSFEEARERVESRYEREESERRLRTFVDGLRRRTRTVINRRALARLTAS
jgi:enamine deaminase RidA (YjgF/YER057c/UK114 family)